MKRLMYAAILAAAAGCYSESKFTEDIADARCTLYEDCDYLGQLDYEEYAECEYYEELQYDFEDPTIWPTGCDFDRAAAIKCIDGINQMSCQDLTEQDFPLTCEQVCLKSD
jgi:hypothetical protein